jgi:hypothetical protein
MMTVVLVNISSSDPVDRWSNLPTLLSTELPEQAGVIV